MSSTISPIFGPEIPEDINLLYRSYLSPSELFQSGQVSKNWHILSGSNQLWMKFYKALNLCKYDTLILDDKNIKNSVILDLKKYHKEANHIINLINSDEIAAMICPYVSLSELKNKPPLDRIFSIMSTVRKDCTDLFTKISLHFQSYLAEKAAYLQNPPSSRELYSAKYEIDNKPFKLLHHLIQKKHGPYKKKIFYDMMDAAERMGDYHTKLQNLQMNSNICIQFSALSIKKVRT